MDYKLSTKTAEGKWFTFGTFKKNQFDKLQASFKLSALEELVALAKSQGKEWVNLAAFENDKKEPAKPASYDAVEGLDDQVPFAWLIPMIAPIAALTMLA